MAAYRTKAWEDLTIADDYMFKLVMKHERFCKRLIEKILKIKIRHIDYLDDEKSLKFRYAGKGVRLDFMLKMMQIQSMILKCRYATMEIRN